MYGHCGYHSHHRSRYYRDYDDCRGDCYSREDEKTWIERRRAYLARRLQDLENEVVQSDE